MTLLSVCYFTVLLTFLSPKLFGFHLCSAERSRAAISRLRVSVSTIFRQLGPYYVPQAYSIDALSFWRSHCLLRPYLGGRIQEGEAGMEVDRDGSQVGLPVGRDKELFGVVYIWGASQHHLDIDVVVKAVCNFCKVLGSSCVDWLWAKIQTEPKQRLEVLGRLQAGTKIVAGEVARMREE
jgi:hypothetical protein